MGVIVNRLALLAFIVLLLAVVYFQIQSLGILDVPT